MKYLLRVFLAAITLSIASCGSSPSTAGQVADVVATAPSQSPVPATGEFERLVGELRALGFAASEGAPVAIGFFSVSPRQIVLGAEQISVFEYPSLAAASADAAGITADGQPSRLVQVTWVAKPHFYVRSTLIVLYVGCSTAVSSALTTLLGSPVAVGTVPCG